LLAGRRLVGRRFAGRSGGRSGRDRESIQPPVGQPSGEQPGGEAPRPQEPYRVRSEHAVPAAAVGDDVGTAGEFGEAGGELVVRDVDRAGDVARGVFGRRAHVEHQDLLVPQPAEELVAGHRLQGAHVAEIAAGGPFDPGDPGSREVLDPPRENGDLLVGEPVVDLDPVPAGGDKPGGGQGVQLGGGVGHLHAGGGRQLLDGALSLGEQVQQFQPHRVGERLADPGELLVHGRLARALVR